ncbi:MAG: GSCFA domain-containing protein [Paludibacteraceae bacterium]|nr:GSCFA domain-containing protein [Paludibacteraceae bacterium]
MNFISTIQIPKAKQTITHHNRVLCVGSCFAQNIARKLCENGFDACNPFGALYNPLSIAQGITYAVQGTPIQPDTLILQDEQWHHMDFHSDFSHSHIDTALAQINTAIANAHQAWQNSHVLIITLGTAWCYTWHQTGKVVGNCHRLPATQFTRHRLSLAQITDTLQGICNQASGKQIILTVSPIRHWKDGAHQNQLSKALLLLACEQMVQQNSNVVYFPSYEIMMDELRDYRFYADDLMHPSHMAIQYIWERFAQTYFDQTTQKACAQWQKIEQMRQHRPFNTQSEAYKQLQQKIAHQQQQWHQLYK